MAEISKHVSGPIRGVFSTDVTTAIGHGTTRRKVQQHILVYVEQSDDGKIIVQPINDKHVPFGEAKTIDSDTLLAEYVPEPDEYQRHVLPAMRELEQTIARGERHRQNGETYSAEHEFQHALTIDVENVRATFGLGLTYLDREENGKADIVFRKLVQLEGTFLAEHKHMFNEFAIKLRQNSMFEQALEFYTRAEELAQGDDHLFFNIARLLSESGELGRAKTYLSKALKHNPELTEAGQLLTYIQKAER